MVSRTRGAEFVHGGENNAARTAVGGRAYDWGYGDATAGVTRRARRTIVFARPPPRTRRNSRWARRHTRVCLARRRRAACALALYYLYHSATTAHENNAKPRGSGARGATSTVRRGGTHATEIKRARRTIASCTCECGRETRGPPRDAGDGQRVLLKHVRARGGDFTPRCGARCRRACARRRRAERRSAWSTLKGEGWGPESHQGAEIRERRQSKLAGRAQRTRVHVLLRRQRPQKRDDGVVDFRRAADPVGDGSVNAGLMLRAGLGAENVTAAHEHSRTVRADESVSCMYQAGIIVASGRRAPIARCPKAAVNSTPSPNQ